MTVYCWDCKDSFEVASDMEHQAYSSKAIKRMREGDTESPWMGLCVKCKVLHERADDPSKTIPFRKPHGSVGSGRTDETALILLIADELREHDLDLSREDAIHMAVDLHFAPDRETNRDFREFLEARSATNRAVSEVAADKTRISPL